MMVMKIWWGLLLHFVRCKKGWQGIESEHLRLGSTTSRRQWCREEISQKCTGKENKKKSQNWTYVIFSKRRNNKIVHCPPGRFAASPTPRRSWRLGQGGTKVLTFWLICLILSWGRKCSRWFNKFRYLSHFLNSKIIWYPTSIISDLTTSLTWCMPSGLSFTGELIWTSVDFVSFGSTTQVNSTPLPHFLLSSGSWARAWRRASSRRQGRTSLPWSWTTRRWSTRTTHH